VDLVEEDLQKLQENVDRLNDAAKVAGLPVLHINIKRQKRWFFGQETIGHNLTVDRVRIQNVTEFEYLGSMSRFTNTCAVCFY